MLPIPNATQKQSAKVAGLTIECLRPGDEEEEFMDEKLGV
jgi:hypothetical protein